MIVKNDNLQYLDQNHHVYHILKDKNNSEMVKCKSRNTGLVEEDFFSFFQLKFCTERNN